MFVDLFLTNIAKHFQRQTKYRYFESLCLPPVDELKRRLCEGFKTLK